MADIWKNKLYFGDNLPVLREYIKDISVDLIYLDPPFNSKATYNVLFTRKEDTHETAQITAFKDTWHWGAESADIFHEIVKNGTVSLVELMIALKKFLGPNDMMAYLVMMAIRLTELHRVLKPTGSLYLHCDPTASHYIKLVLDSIFGPTAFRNEIIWKRTPFSGSSKARAKQFPKSHDVILFYSRENDWTWNSPTIPYSDKYLSRFGWKDERGQYRKTLLKTYSQETLERLREEDRLIEPKHVGSKYGYKQYLHESSGTCQIDDIWTDINMINPVAKERLGYPTQKPEALLERIINASSNVGDLVLDPFCGCGTTVAVAERLKRNWIGIDITHLAISLMKNRLNTSFGYDISPYEVIGVPVDVGSAQALAEQDRYQFEWWALSLIEARPAQDKKKGADRGIDGYIHFYDDNSGEIKKIVIQVKSGNVGVAQIRDLKGVIEREKAVIGALITLQLPTSKMVEEINTGEAEDYYTCEVYGPKRRFQRIQILTIEDLLNGHKKLDYPQLAPDTFRQAERKYKDTLEQPELI
ncbi:MAG: DNA methyltransferase [Desulfomonilaceae bacterium]